MEITYLHGRHIVTLRYKKYYRNIYRIFVNVYYATSFRYLERTSTSVVPASKIRLSAMLLLLL